MEPEVTFETARGRDIWALPALTADQVRALPAVFPLAYAARAWDIGYTQGMAGAKDGTLPFPVVRLGPRGYKVVRSELMKSLGITEAGTPATSAASDPAA